MTAAHRTRSITLACLATALPGCAGPAAEPVPTPQPPAPVEVIEEIEAEQQPDELPPPEAPQAAGLFAFEVNLLDGSAASLSTYSGKVALVVNVASRCGYTPQYAGLQALADEFAEQGLVVLAFPSNDFGGQEPGSPAEIAAFCTDRYGVTFPMFEKCEVQSGPGQSPVYTYLQGQTGSAPNWNFCKYLVGRDGQALGFYPSKVEPSALQLRADIVQALD